MPYGLFTFARFFPSTQCHELVGWAVPGNFLSSLSDERSSTRNLIPRFFDKCCFAAITCGYAFSLDPLSLYFPSFVHFLSDRLLVQGNYFCSPVNAVIVWIPPCKHDSPFEPATPSPPFPLLSAKAFTRRFSYPLERETAEIAKSDRFSPCVQHVALSPPLSYLSNFCMKLRVSDSRLCTESGTPSQSPGAVSFRFSDFPRSFPSFPLTCGNATTCVRSRGCVVDV